MTHKALLGKSGVGKSYTIRGLLKDNPNYGLKTASTGIAAINLQDEYGTSTTINSALGFFDTKQLLFKSLKPGDIDKKVNEIADKYKYLIIDEVSMVGSAQIDLIHRVFERVNKDRSQKGLSSIYLHVVGDFGQLPSVDDKPAFLAKCWPSFEVDYLTEVKRQSDREFIEALHHIRMARAKEALPYFESLGFHKNLDKDFKGTTFLSKNKDVDVFNNMKLDELRTKEYYLSSEREGQLKPEWKNIPEDLRLKIGALVVLLMNNHKACYANGDLAYVEEVSLIDETVTVRLLRNNSLVNIGKVKVKNVNSSDDVLGYINYIPLRVAFASTIHKAQGLTLDNIQIKMGDSFMSRCHGMFYVALSRARSSQGIRLVGDKNDFLSSPCFDEVYRQYVR
jgi:ATP-dependent exoDNAse (exonuclease V) alpha subunit